MSTSARTELLSDWQGESVGARALVREPYARMFSVRTVDLTQLAEQLRKAAGGPLPG